MKTTTTALFVLALSFVGLLAEDNTKFRHSKARQAKIQYEHAIKKAAFEYEGKVKSAEKQFDNDLNTALKDATMKGDLDEALKIRDVKEQIGKEKVVNQVQEQDPTLQIMSAVYGVNQSWFDVTDTLIRYTSKTGRWSAVVSNKYFGDPAPGYRVGNTLLIRYYYKGQYRLMAVYEGRPIQIPKRP